CFVPERDYSPLYEKFLQAAAKHGVAIEINTAGLRKDCKEMYPSRDILKRARQLGVGLTFGSDAHMPAEVAMDFAGAVALAKDVGYTHWCRFRQRQRELVPL
ncbi:MAG TPA: histidinol phosphate phosphatase, partial [Verrucomicrobiae bacterium]|nr:histidinol phosphate phosphatase [Verrucomicrobiae bacterium]